MDEMKAVTSPWMAITRRLHSYQLCFEGFSVMLGWRWESPERGQRQPLFGCRRQRDKTLNKVSKF
jgi:hypothetical protein